METIQQIEMKHDFKIMKIRLTGSSGRQVTLVGPLENFEANFMEHLDSVEVVKCNFTGFVVGEWEDN